MSLRPGPLLLYLATAAGIGLTTRALRGHPPPLPLALLFLALYLGLIVLGLALPQLQMWGHVLCRVPRASGVSLTLEVHRPELLDSALTLLRAHGFKATLMVPVGLLEELGPALRRSREEGHEVGLLAPERPALFRRPIEEIHEALRRGVERFEEALGERPRWVRVPGWLSPRVVRVVAELELELVGWNLRAEEDPRGGRVLRGRLDAPGFPQLGVILGRISARNLEAVTLTELAGPSPE